MITADQLHVISVLYNPLGWKSRYRNYQRFAREMKKAGVTFYTVEAVSTGREFVVTAASCPQHIQLTTDEPLWHKEAMINVALANLPPEAKYVAWIDADVTFLRETWATDTIRFLQSHPVVQMFQSAVELGPEEEALHLYQSFAAWYCNKKSILGDELHASSSERHPGYAWAARREVVQHGMFDRGALGSGDLIMAYCMIGRRDKLGPLLLGENQKPDSAWLTPGLEAAFADWQSIVFPMVGTRLGYVPGTLVHHWHGARSNRKYIFRWARLVAQGFDPRVDIRKAPNGLWELTETGERFREEFIAYFKGRGEDSFK